MQLIISDPETRKAYQKKLEEATFLGKKIGSEVLLDSVGLKGYKGIITGGSDKDGFPMDASIEGSQRRKILKRSKVKTVKKEKKTKIKVVKRKITVRGNTIAGDIAQVNIKIAKKGDGKLEEIFGKAEEVKEEKAGETKESSKEEKKKEDKKEVK